MEEQKLPLVLVTKYLRNRSNPNAMLTVFQFEREAVVLANWLRDQEVLALSQDFGQDLRHAVNY
ncbi:hypothetical protein BpHYR1_029057 [Brachionus plicatilis]|uniref:Uncharacterized protein n=1 Tax=Brachionus plicatilis TaxID=10195 RepID=A0A3M7PYL0_BRAPC|nr:hypothetical protein BpHYR1_029057 [Brachionus plicatilis]